jgi:hypothetical protein
MEKGLTPRSELGDSDGLFARADAPWIVIPIPACRAGAA